MITDKDGNIVSEGAFESRKPSDHTAAEVFDLLSEKIGEVQRGAD